MKLGVHIGLRVDQVWLIIINPLNPPEPDLICLQTPEFEVQGLEHQLQRPKRI